MNPVRSRIGFAVAAALFFLHGCSSLPGPVDAEDPAWLAKYETRGETVADLGTWMLEGRLAVSDDRDGGSGRLRWREGPEETQLDFHGALGRGAWRLHSGPTGAVLELASGESYRADSVGELVRGQLGWHIPAESLSWWVRGVQAPGDFLARIPGEDGTLSTLDQAGWRIEYGRYREVGGLLLPLKLTARQADRTVKLAVRDWTLGSGDD